MPPRWGKTLMGSGSREVNRQRLRLWRPTVRWPPLGASLMGCAPRTSVYVPLCSDGSLTSVPRSSCGARHTGDTLKFLLILSTTLFSVSLSLASSPFVICLFHLSSQERSILKMSVNLTFDPSFPACCCVIPLHPFDQAHQCCSLSLTHTPVARWSSGLLSSVS